MRVVVIVVIVVTGGKQSQLQSLDWSLTIIWLVKDYLIIFIYEFLFLKNKKLAEKWSKEDGQKALQKSVERLSAYLRWEKYWAPHSEEGESCVTALPGRRDESE